MNELRLVINHPMVHIALMPNVFLLQSLKAPELKEKLQESEKLIQEMTVTWEEKLRKTEEIATVRKCATTETHNFI